MKGPLKTAKSDHRLNVCDDGRRGSVDFSNEGSGRLYRRFRKMK